MSQDGPKVSKVSADQVQRAHHPNTKGGQSGLECNLDCFKRPHSNHMVESRTCWSPLTRFKTGIPNIQVTDMYLLSDQQQHQIRSEVHNEYNALESSSNHPSTPLPIPLISPWKN